MSTTPSVPSELSDGIPVEVRQRLRTLRTRYGRARFTSPANRLELAANRRRFMLAEIRKEIAELERRAEAIESELRGFGQGVAALAREEIVEYERSFPEAWSPTPVLGFRLWMLNDNKLVGARQVWETPSFVATCAAYPDPDEIPHTDERCGRLGCGVYATKEFDSLLELHVRESDRSYAAGLVAMTGKVVEHEDGYRATQAEVVALALIGDDREVYTTDRKLIAEAFGDPMAILGARSAPLRTPVLDHIAAHLSTERGMPWI